MYPTPQATRWLLLLIAALSCSAAANSPPANEPTMPNSHLVALTHTGIRPASAFAFVLHSRRILAQLAQQPGVIAYNARLSLWRMDASTWTAWRDRDALDAFLAQGAHRRAQREGSSALTGFRTRLLECENGWLPTSWRAAREAMTVAPPGCRYINVERGS